VKVGDSSADDISIEIYLGDVIEHESERRVLSYLVDHFKARRCSAVILANFNVRSRQVDFFVAAPQVTLVVEAKGYSRPVRGNANGLWETKTAAGGWRKIRNPYAQALTAKNAFRDEMRAWSREDVAYPDAALVIAPDIPADSQIGAGDFKVAICDLSSLGVQLSKVAACKWPLERWRDMAATLRLSRVQTVEAACSSQFLAAERVLETYSESFRLTYGPVAASLIADTLSMGGEATSSADVIQHVLDAHADALLRGPSGCGKTLLATQIAVSFLAKRGIPLMLKVRHYDGSIQELLDREASLLGVSSAIALLRAAKTLEKPLMLIADGYNECRDRLNLTRGLRAMALRHGVQVIVTSQADIERGDLLSLETVSVAEPSFEVKAAIAGLGSACHHEDGLEILLNSVSSGLEARLVRDVGRSLKAGAGRFDLFDAFARVRLETDAPEGIRQLARFAATLVQRISFSLPIRELDRLADASGASPSIVGRLMEEGLLVKHVDRVSFRHELFLAAFASESVIREANGDAKSILAALSSPRYHASRTFILGAIDDDALLDHILRELTSSELLVACSKGDCGHAARNWVNRRCDEVAARLKGEAAQLTFMFSDSGWGQVAANPATVWEWSPPDRAILGVIADGLRNAERLDLYLEAVGELDSALRRGFDDLRAEARTRKISLRSGLFADAYLFGRSHVAGVTQISSMLHGGWMGSRAPKDSAVRQLIEAAWKRLLTPGQTYFLLMLSKYQEDPGAIVAPYLPDLLGERWSLHPYHLQLDLLDCVHWCWDLEEPHRTALIDALETILPKVNPMLSGIVFECLDNLGAVEPSHLEHIETIRSQMRELLSNESAPDHRESAWSIYIGQFDHPLSRSYIEVVDELEPEEKERFMLLACEAASETGFFLAPLINDIAKCGNPAAGPSLQRWAKLPARNSFMPQEAAAVFVVAHIALGHLGCALPSDSPTDADDSAEALSACGRLFYWVSRRDIPGDERARQCDACWGVLMQHDKGAALASLMTCESALRHGMATVLQAPADERSLIHRFPQEAAEVCRAALTRTRQRQGYFPAVFEGGEQGHLVFAIQVLARLGEEQDLVVLRKLSDDPALGTTAIEAIRGLEGRTMPSAATSAVSPTAP